MERGTSILFYLLFFFWGRQAGNFFLLQWVLLPLVYGEKLCANPPPSCMVKNYVPIHLKGAISQKGMCKAKVNWSSWDKWGMGSRGLINPKPQTLVKLVPLLNPKKPQITSSFPEITHKRNWWVCGGGYFSFFNFFFRTMGIKYYWVWTQGSQHFWKKKGQIPGLKIFCSFPRLDSSLRDFQMIRTHNFFNFEFFLEYVKLYHEFTKLNKFVQFFL